MTATVRHPSSSYPFLALAQRWDFDYGTVLTLADMLLGRDLTSPYWRDQAVAAMQSRSAPVQAVICEEVRAALRSVWGRDRFNREEAEPTGSNRYWPVGGFPGNGET